MDLRERGVWIVVAGQILLLFPQVEDRAEVIYRQSVVATAPKPHRYFSHEHLPEAVYTASSPVRPDHVQVASGAVVTAGSARGTGAASAAALVVRSPLQASREILSRL